MRIRVELRPSKGSAYEVDCVAVLISADNSVSAVLTDGSLRLLATRSWEKDVPDRWQDAHGARIFRPLIHGDPDMDVLLHCGTREYADGKRGPWTLTGYKHVPTLNLRRRDNKSGAPMFCITHRERGWIKGATDKGSDSILLAPTGFSRETLLLHAARATPRERLSALAN